MILEKVFENERKKIDKETKTKKDVVDYLSNFINSNYNELKKVFNEDGERLYWHVLKLFDYLEKDISSPIGDTLSPEQCPSPDIKLGLTKYEKLSEVNSAKRLTERGENLLNEYRKIRGLCTIKKS